MMRRMMRRRIQITMALCLAVTSVASTITLPGGVAQAGLPIVPLSTVDVPQPANLSDFVQDKSTAIALGKALFWDMQVGSNGTQACATCHFHAGADNRTTNQLSPALNRRTPDLSAPDPDTSFHIGGLNYTLQADDFPFHKLSDPQDRTSSVVRDSSTIAGSQGVFKNDFPAPPALLATDRTAYDCTHVADPTFGFDVNVGGVNKRVNVRQVTARNAPTVINAVFNDRNFWDGRAQNDFNGVSPFGTRDQSARIWELVNDQPQQITVAITNSSLASQAVGPPNNPVEMACNGSQWANIGHKLLDPRVVPLGKQQVSPYDSVLGSLANTGGVGLNTTYAALVQKAFKPEYTSDTVRVGDGQFTEMEANFSLFFGLAVQLYEAKLVSDETPVDAYLAGNTDALTQQQQQGLAIFQGQGRCANCHGGPELTNASVQNVALERLERMLMGNGSAAVYDDGFYNTGVRPTFEDVGVGGFDPFGNPLSESRYDQQLGLAVPVVAAPGEPVPAGPLQATEPTAVDGSFKTPDLRNVELTGPYMHNGGMATLRQVVDFYNRGGDFADQNQANLDPDIVPLGLTTDQENALVSFLLGLTDPRVKWEKAPFDHPSLCVPNGEVGNQTVVIEDIANPGQAQDRPMLCLPAVGHDGAKTPLQPFLGLDPYQTLPAISITSKPADLTNDPNPSFTFTVDAGASSVQCALDASSYTACQPADPTNDPTPTFTTFTFTVDGDGLTDGAHSFKVRAEDADGNVNVVLDTFTVDTAPPAVSIIGQPANPTNNVNPAFTVSAEEGATLTCSLTPAGEADAFAPCRIPQSYRGLADGAYTFKVQAVDAAGNSSAASSAFTIDTVAPAVPTDVTATAASGSEIDLSWTATDTVDVAGYRVFRDGGTTSIGTVTSGTTFADTDLAPSSTHRYTVVAVDAAGNASAPAAAAVATTLTPPATATSTALPATATPTAPPATATPTAPPAATATPAAATATLPAAPATATTPPTATSAVPTTGSTTPRAVIPTTTAGLAARPRPTATKTAHLDPVGRPAKRSSTSAHKRSSTTRQQAQHVRGHQRQQVHHGRVGHQVAPHSALAQDLPQRIGAVLRHLDDTLHHLLRIVGVRLSL